MRLALEERKRRESGLLNIYECSEWFNQMSVTLVSKCSINTVYEKLWFIEIMIRNSVVPLFLFFLSLLYLLSRYDAKLFPLHIFKTFFWISPEIYSFARVYNFKAYLLLILERHQLLERSTLFFDTWTCSRASSSTSRM